MIQKKYPPSKHRLDKQNNSKSPSHIEPFHSEQTTTTVSNRPHNEKHAKIKMSKRGGNHTTKRAMTKEKKEDGKKKPNVITSILGGGMMHTSGVGAAEANGGGEGNVRDGQREARLQQARDHREACGERVGGHGVWCQGQGLCPV